MRQFTTKDYNEACEFARKILKKERVEFYNAIDVAANVKVLCAVGDFGNEIFNLPPKLNSSSNSQLTTIAPIAQNTCYKLAADY